MPYKGGDQSFFGVGVPYISFATGYTPEELERLNWAFLSPWLHTEADTLDKVDKDLYETHLRFFATLILRLCNSDAIPYDLTKPATLLQSQLEELKALAFGIELVDLDSLLDKTAQLGVAVQVLAQREQEGKEAIQVVNEACIKASRALSFLWTEADKYDQDPYGYWLIGKPIPRLYVPILKMKELGAGQEFNLWATKYVRERNRVSDALGNALDCLALATRLVEALE